MDDGIDRGAGEHLFDEFAVGDRAQDVGVVAGRDVEPDHIMSRLPQPGGQMAPEPTA